MQGNVRAFLSLTGPADEQGAAPSTRVGQKGWTEVYAWSHAIASPRDAASGQPTGKRRHEPLVITKPVDDASPGLMKALVEDQVMAECVLEIWRPSTSADKPAADDLLDKPREKALEIYRERLRRSRLEEEREHTIRLQNARVARIETEMLDGWELEYVSLIYERITWARGEGDEHSPIESSWEQDEVVGDPIPPDRPPIEGPADSKSQHVKVKAREDDKKIWAVAWVAHRRAKKLSKGKKAAAGVELSYTFIPKSTKDKPVTGKAVTDTNGEALIPFPPTLRSPYRFSLTEATGNKSLQRPGVRTK